MMTPDEWKDCVALINTYWGNQQLDDTQTAIFYTKVGQFDQAVMLATINDLAEKSKWRPSLAELLESVQGTDPEFMIYLDAFKMVKQQIYSVGSYKQPSFPDHPEIMRAVNMIGWQQLCGYDLDKENFMVDRFKIAYDESCRIVSQERKRQRNEQIAGVSDAMEHLPSVTGKPPAR